MISNPRPLLLGYIRADALGSGTDLPRVEADLAAFADREEFGLGTVFVERGATPGAFHALLAEAARSEAWGVVVPDLRHVTDEEHHVMRLHEHNDVRTRILVASFIPLAGGPGAASPVQRQVCHSSQPD